MHGIPTLVTALVAALTVVTPFALLMGRRGGRYRALPGWIGAWAQFAVLLVFLSRLTKSISFPILGLVMFIALKQFFFLTPLRPQDRWAIFATYLAVPLALWPAWTGSFDLLSAAMGIGFFLLIPVLLSVVPRQPGLLDSLGRVLLGVILFVFCAAHLGLMTHQPAGRLELFGIVGLFADLPQRLTGRLRPGEERTLPVLGLAVSIALAAGLGAIFGPKADITTLQGGIVGALTALAVVGGSLVADAVAHDLSRTASDAMLGRAAFLDHTLPALYAAPIFYHYLQNVAPR
jgi:phosphatidate cytidylyltransferase